MGPLSALRAHTEAPYTTGFHRQTHRALNRPWAARAGKSGAARLLAAEVSVTVSPAAALVLVPALPPRAAPALAESQAEHALALGLSH